MSSVWESGMKFIVMLGLIVIMIAPLAVVLLVVVVSEEAIVTE